jgi:hypothetical protein
VGIIQNGTHTYCALSAGERRVSALLVASVTPYEQNALSRQVGADVSENRD